MGKLWWIVGLSVILGPAGGLQDSAAGAPGRDADRPLCAGVPATMVGTRDADELVGTDGRDVIVALAGDDRVFSGGGSDLVCLGDGFDFVRSGAGADRLRGGRGDDNLVGGFGPDMARGQGGIDSLFGGAGPDVLRAGRGSGLVVEALVGGDGDDQLIGGRGLDSAEYFDAPGRVIVDLRQGLAQGAGRDVLVGVEGVVGSRHDDLIRGDKSANGLFGLQGADLIKGRGSGQIEEGTADVISGDTGDDVLLGGAGEDIATFGRLQLPVTVDLDRAVASGQGEDRLLGFEGVEGSIFDDVLLGDEGGNVLSGSLGNDDLEGGAGDDVVAYNDVVGPVEVDLMQGSATGSAAGVDTLGAIEGIWGSNQGDVLRGDEGSNRILGLRGDDLLEGQAGVDSLDGGQGSDTCLDDEATQLTRCETPEATRAGTFGLSYWSHWLGSSAQR